MKPIFFFACLSALTLTGCGRFLDKFSRFSGGFTEVKIVPEKNGNRSDLLEQEDQFESLVVLQGGLVVYAVNDETGKSYSAAAADEGGAVSLTVPNGNYHFYGVGWEGAGLTSGPTGAIRLRCGTGGSRTLGGQGTTVNINLADLDACHDNPYFSPALAREPGSFPTLSKLKFVFCGKNSNLATRTLSGGNSYCAGSLASSHFFKGTTSAKMDHGAYFSSSNTLIFSATKDATGSPPAQPYELFRYEIDSGKQTKIGIDFPGTTPSGALKPKTIPNRQKLAFVRDNGTNSPDELWIYNLANGSLTRVSHATPLASSSGVKEFRISDGGDYMVFVADQDTIGVFELYSVPIGASDTYAAPTKISGSGGGSGLVTGTGIKDCGACTNDDRYFFQISPGTSNNYVVFSSTKALASRYDLHIASIDGANIPNATVHGAGPASIYTGTMISSTSEISVANDFIDYFKFSYNGSHLLYHAHVNTGPVDKVLQLDVTYVAGTSLVIPAPILIKASQATDPWFVTGKSTNRAAYFSHDGTYALVNTVDMASPGGTNFIVFGAPITPGKVGYASLIDSDTKVVAAFKDATDMRELRSAPVGIASNYNGGSVPDGSSVSYTGGILSGGKKLQPISAGGGGGGRYFISTTDATKLFFITDMGTASIYKAYFGTVGSPGSTDVSGAGVNSAGKSVTSIALSGTDIPYFTAAIDIATKPELYETQLTAAPSVTRKNSYLVVDSIDSISGKDEQQMAGFPDRIMMDSRPLGATSVSEAWLFNPASLSFSRASTLAGDTYGAGRFMVRMLKSGDGGTTFATAQESACLRLDSPQNDGDQIVTDVRFPFGAGTGSSPFAVAVDVYPLATSCAGSPETHTFSNGLSAANPCTAGSTACLLGDSVNTSALFLKDQ